MQDDLQEIWLNAYSSVPEQLQKIRNVKSVVTAFNTNIDAVIKISGAELSKLAENAELNTYDNGDDCNKQIKQPADVIRGILRCFVKGIAEEWFCDNYAVYEWMRDNLKYNRLQMGGQGGIVANVMAVLGVGMVCAHTSSHPQLQARQFLNRENLSAIDGDGKTAKAADINRDEDLPLIHWIIEFDGGDMVNLGTKTYTCPKSNRFIATYDPANLSLQINDGFLRYMQTAKYDYLVLSGYHNLTSERGGLERLEASVPLIREWKNKNPQGVIHMELASTADLRIREAIMRRIVPLVDSVGLNEREAIDVQEVMHYDLGDGVVEGDDVAELFAIIKCMLEKTGVARIQLHLFGLYITLKKRGVIATAEQTKRGMMLAATVAASKAGLGNIDDTANLLWSHGRKVAERSLQELKKLADYLQNPELMVSGITEFDDFEVIAVPTILIDKPLTLVGMGDTISSISLVGAR